MSWQSIWFNNINVGRRENERDENTNPKCRFKKDRDKKLLTFLFSILVLGLSNSNLFFPLFLIGSFYCHYYHFSLFKSLESCVSTIIFEWKWILWKKYTHIHLGYLGYRMCSHYVIIICHALVIIIKGSISSFVCVCVCVVCGGWGWKKRNEISKNKENEEPVEWVREKEKKEVRMNEKFYHIHQFLLLFFRIDPIPYSTNEIHRTGKNKHFFLLNEWDPYLFRNFFFTQFDVILF